MPVDDELMFIGLKRKGGVFLIAHQKILLIIAHHKFQGLTLKILLSQKQAEYLLPAVDAYMNLLTIAL